MPKSSKRQTARARRKRSTSSSYIVFISHSSYDAWIARTMAEKIQVLGAECRLDEKDLEGGDIVVDEIIRGINACHEAVVLVSPNSVRWQWVSFEIGSVLAQHKRVTPILNNVKPNEMAPMQGIKAIDLNKFDQFLAELKRRITRR